MKFAFQIYLLYAYLSKLEVLQKSISIAIQPFLGIVKSIWLCDIEAKRWRICGFLC
jgi:hypothetical protein